MVASTAFVDPHHNGGLVLTPSPKTAEFRKATRLLWPDVARGIGIILVVLGHAIGGLAGSGAIVPTSPWQAVFYMIYTFHMPLFFMLSGLFIRSRLENRSSAFLKRSLLHIAYPYFLWGSIQFVVITQLGSFVNAPYALRPDFLLRELWSPPSQFWFLYVLFVAQVVYWLVMPVIGDVALLGVAIVLRLIADAASLPATLDDVCRYALFFAVGVTFGPWLMARLATLRRPALAASFAALAWAIVTAAGLMTGVSALGPWELPASLAGSLAVIAISCALLERSNLTAWFAYLGRRSMPIYLLHVLFVAGTRIGLKVVAGATTVSVVLPLAVAMGIVGPLIVFEVANRLRLARALALG